MQQLGSAVGVPAPGRVGLLSVGFSVPQPSPKPVWSSRKDFPHHWREKNLSISDRSPRKCQQCTRCCPEPRITRAGFSVLGGALGETWLQKTPDSSRCTDTVGAGLRGCPGSQGCPGGLGVGLLEKEGVLAGGRPDSDPQLPHIRAPQCSCSQEPLPPPQHREASRL